MRHFLLAASLACLLGCGHAEEYTATYKVIDRSHTPSSTGVGVTTGGNVAITGSGEVWELIVQDESGNVFAVGVSSKDWRDYPVGTVYSQKRTKWVND